MRHSRRARLVLTVLLLAAFTLITLDYRSGALNGVRSAVASVFGPIENAVADVTHPIGSWFSSIAHVGSYRHDNEELRKQIAALQGQLHLTTAQQAQLVSARKLLHLAGVGRFKIVPAQVIAYGGGLGGDQTATINRGSADGIAVNQTVIDGNGLVGQTIVVGHSTSTILLSDDPTFCVGARLSGKQLELGSVCGGGQGKPMSFTLFSATAPMTVGEDLVTAGSTNNIPFVPEVPIGTVTSIRSTSDGLSRIAMVKPFVDFTGIDIVAVVVSGPTTVKHDILLPASPTPAPTVTVTVTAPPPTPGSTATTTPPSTPTTSHSP
jgi:rod shape-determining protein MreC